MMTIEAIGDVRFVTLGYAAYRNGLDEKAVCSLSEAVREAGEDEKARFLVLRGLPGWFCLGATNSLLVKSSSLEWTRDQRADLTRQFQNVAQGLLESPLMTVAVIDGLAAGAGVDIALACDLRLATSRARVSLLYSKLGLVPDCGFTLIQRRLAGQSSLIMYAESQTLLQQRLHTLELAEPITDDIIEPPGIAAYLGKRFRFSRSAFAASKQLEFGTWSEALREDCERAAQAQAIMLENTETRERLDRILAMQS